MGRRQYKKKRPAPVARAGERATPERRHQLGGVITEVVDRDATGGTYIKRHRARIECMLDYYFRKHRISDAQYMAGLKFREIYLRTTYGYSFKVLCNPFLMEAGQADHEGRMLAHLDCGRLLSEATKQLMPEELTIVRNVCGYDEFAGGRDKKRILMRALDRLAAFWSYT